MKDDGGPAFPAMVEREEMSASTNSYRIRREPEGGMSLRDYFAGQALLGLAVNHIEYPEGEGNIARIAYAYADAMLEARTK